MALPAANARRLTPARMWRLVCDPAPGRLGYALRMAAGCTATVLIGEIWHVPELAVPTLVTMALWQKDRVTNALAGVGISVLILVVLAIIYGLIRLTLDHPLGLVVVITILSFGFFFLGSASKLKPVSYMLGLITVYGLIAIDQVPVGEVVTRALLYTDLFISIPAFVMVVLGLLICPSPKRVLTDTIAAMLRQTVGLLRDPTPLLRERARDVVTAGTGGMKKALKMAGLEKIWAPHDLACLGQASGAALAVLGLALDATREGRVTGADTLIATIEEMAGIFEEGDYPTDIMRPQLCSASAPVEALADLLPGFTVPVPLERTDKKTSGGGFFAADAFTNPTHVRFAVKGTAAVMASYLVFKTLDWQGIHTCIITCFIVALPTMGEMIAKLTLRIGGALVGGTLGILAIIFLMPHLNGVTGLLALVFVVSLLGAWVKAGDERIAYAGFQIGIAFYLTDLTGFGPTSDMATARDRIVGILLGYFLTYAVFTSFWPSSAYDHLPSRMKALIPLLRRQMAANTPQAREVTFAAMQAGLLEGERTLEYATAEPIHMQSDMTDIAAYDRALRSVERVSYALLHDRAVSRGTAALQELDHLAS